MKDGKAESSLTMDQLLNKIALAKNVKEIDALREDIAFHMHTDSRVLKIWQDKYWSLRCCPTCGQEWDGERK